jgi:LysM domain-containing protein
MEKDRSTPARVFATLALAAALLFLILLISSSLGGGGSGGSNTPASAGRAGRSGSVKAHIPAVYVVKNGDTLTSIARKTGVSVVRIQTLNPHVDPQILISGERLRLR